MVQERWRPREVLCVAHDKETERLEIKMLTIACDLANLDLTFQRGYRG